MSHIGYTWIAARLLTRYPEHWNDLVKDISHPFQKCIGQKLCVVRRSVRGVSAAPQAHYPHFLKASQPGYILSLANLFSLEFDGLRKTGLKYCSANEWPRNGFLFPSKKRGFWIQQKNLTSLKLKLALLVKTVALVLVSVRQKQRY